MGLAAVQNQQKKKVLLAQKCAYECDWPEDWFAFTGTLQGHP